MNSLFTIRIAIVALGILVDIGASPNSPRERTSFNLDWRFMKGDPPGTTGPTYADLRPWLLATGAGFKDTMRSDPNSVFAARDAHARDGQLALRRPEGNFGEDLSYTKLGFDDREWRKLTLPHDWGIEGPFVPEISGATGKLKWWGVGWYRKRFIVSAADQGKQVYLQIDGAMSHAAVWVNGQLAGGWPYGYASWQLDLTPYVNFGGENVLAIRLDNPPDSSRWYPGAGIYRNVWLLTTEPLHVAQWGTFVSTPQVSPDRATVSVQVIVQNDSQREHAVEVGTAIYVLAADGNRTGEPVARIAGSPATLVAPGGQALVARNCIVPKPLLWSLAETNRYIAVTTITEGKKTVDEYETPFGVRTIAFTPDRGFLLNGERIPIQGVCSHHDLGALGAALNLSALERQLRILREMGCNAIRTSHNPPAPELLELADRIGFLIMDETFDCWTRGKLPNDYHLRFADWHEQDTRALVRRDRNHPSVVLWSVGNEVGEQGLPEAWKLAKHLAAIVREEDPTRSVSAACNLVAAAYNGFQTAMDAFGFNYKPTEYPRFRASAPHIPVFGSETASCVSSRGEYFFPVSKNKADGRADFQVSSYDLYTSRSGSTPDAEFQGLDEAPFACGEFVWTGFDYLGEATPYNADTTDALNFSDPSQQREMAKELAQRGRIGVPARSSYFGIVDLAGFKKDRFFLYQARWRQEFPMAHLLPHWTWPDRIGQRTPVHVYTSGDEAELFLNAQSLGRKKRALHEYRLRWDDVSYAPGELHVVTYRNGAKWAEDTVRTAGPATRIELTADRSTVRANGSDLVFITGRILDATGTLVPRARDRVRFGVTGPAEIIATDNGDPTCLEAFQLAERSAFNGLVLAIVRVRSTQPGAVTVTATADGLAVGIATFEVK